MEEGLQAVIDQGVREQAEKIKQCFSEHAAKLKSERDAFAAQEEAWRQEVGRKQAELDSRTSQLVVNETRVNAWEQMGIVLSGDASDVRNTHLSNTICRVARGIPNVISTACVRHATL